MSENQPKYHKIKIIVTDNEGEGYELTVHRARDLDTKVKEPEPEFVDLYPSGFIPGRSRELDFRFCFHAVPDASHNEYENIYTVKKLPRPVDEEEKSYVYRLELTTNDCGPRLYGIFFNLEKAQHHAEQVWSHNTGSAARYIKEWQEWGSGTHWSEISSKANPDSFFRIIKTEVQ